MYLRETSVWEVTKEAAAKVPALLQRLSLVVLAVGFGAMYGFFWTHDYMKPDWDAAARSAALVEFQMRAVRVDAARWDNTVEGAPQFNWKRCTALGVKK